ncbi:MAG: hypothetical protein AAF827_04685 [Cyanobacteria bacterium P01_D01_bin.6]
MSGPSLDLTWRVATAQVERWRTMLLKQAAGAPLGETRTRRNDGPFSLGITIQQIAHRLSFPAIAFLG